MAKWTKAQREKFTHTMRAKAKQTDALLATTKPSLPTRRVRYIARVLSRVEDQLVSEHFTFLSWGEFLDVVTQKPAIEEIHVVRK